MARKMQVSGRFTERQVFVDLNEITVCIRGINSNGELMIPHVNVNSPLNNVRLFKWQADSIVDCGFRVYETEYSNELLFVDNYANSADIGIDYMSNSDLSNLKVGDKVEIKTNIFDKKSNVSYTEIPTFNYDSEKIEIVDYTEAGDPIFEMLKEGETELTCSVVYFPDSQITKVLVIKSADSKPDVKPVEPVIYTIHMTPDSVIMNQTDTDTKAQISITSSDDSEVDMTKLSIESMNTEVFTASLNETGEVSFTPVAEGSSNLRITYGDTKAVADVFVIGESDTEAPEQDDLVELPADFEERLAAVSTKDAFTALLAEIGMTPKDVGVDFSKGTLLKDAKAALQAALND